MAYRTSRAPHPLGDWREIKEPHTNADGDDDRRTARRWLLTAIALVVLATAWMMASGMTRDAPDDASPIILESQ